MEITQETTAEIERIRQKTCCERGFRCCQSGFTRVGRVRLLANGRLLDCLEDNADTCHFAVPFGDGFFCQCPLRAHLAAKYHI